jgi:hypothetical protein
MSCAGQPAFTGHDDGALNFADPSDFPRMTVTGARSLFACGLLAPSGNQRYGLRRRMCLLHRSSGTILSVMAPPNEARISVSEIDLKRFFLEQVRLFEHFPADKVEEIVSQGQLALRGQRGHPRDRRRQQISAC